MYLSSIKWKFVLSLVFFACADHFNNGYFQPVPPPTIRFKHDTEQESSFPFYNVTIFHNSGNFIDVKYTWRITAQSICQFSRQVDLLLYDYCHFRLYQVPCRDTIEARWITFLKNVCLWTVACLTWARTRLHAWTTWRVTCIQFNVWHYCQRLLQETSKTERFFRMYNWFLF